MLQLYTAGTITQKTLLYQLTEGEVLGDEFDVEEEIAATEQAGLIDMERPEPEEDVSENLAEPEDIED